MIAALYVMTGGVYYGIDDVDPWDEARDARSYDGPHAVVAHPPCQRWGRYWYGGPTLHKLGRRKQLGADGGCFSAALASVRRFGGVLEHPAASHAWRCFGLNRPPHTGGWVPADYVGGWTCHVEQGHYGHRARKATWLYAVGCDLPSLRWGASTAAVRLDDGFHSKHQRAEAMRHRREVADRHGIPWESVRRPPRGMGQDMRDRRRSVLDELGVAWCAPERMSTAESSATPLPFRDVLLGMARSAEERRAA